MNIWAALDPAGVFAMLAEQQLQTAPGCRELSRELGTATEGAGVTGSLTIVTGSLTMKVALQVAIAYRPVDIGGGNTTTVLIGLRLTVQPVNLLNALIAWRDGAHDNPSELLDRIERILRGGATAEV